jgi:hypothetical protein
VRAVLRCGRAWIRLWGSETSTGQAAIESEKGFELSGGAASHVVGSSKIKSSYPSSVSFAGGPYVSAIFNRQ